MLNEILTHIIFTGAAFSLILSLVFFFIRNKTPSLYFMFVLLVSMTVTQTYAWLNIREIYFETLWLNYAFIPFNFLIGPSVYFFFFSTVKNGYEIDSKKLYAYLPGAFVLLLLPILSSLDLLPRDVHGYFKGKGIGLADILLLTAFMYNNIFYFLILKHSAVVFDFHSLQSEAVARIFLSLFVFIGFINIYGIFAMAYKNLTLMYIGSAMITIIIILFFLFSYRFPEFFLRLESLIETARIQKKEKNSGVKKSTLEGLNLKELHIDLVELMNNEKLYMEEDLTVARVADELGIKPYQLSEFLNSHLNINFAQFVNRFRIEKAKQLLLQEEKASILSVAFKVGFNSKANFNLLFSTYVGKSPSQFLKEMKKKNV